MTKLILYGLLIIFVLMQLFQPDRNTTPEMMTADLANHYKVPDSVETVLNTVCYDCHSNNTDYPWFINVQPVGWYMQSKITNGKKHLNFSEFANYSKEEAMHKLSDIDDVMKTNRMPLKAYKWYNDDANLTDAQRKTISAWALNLREQIRTDSLAALNADSVKIIAR